MQATERSGLVAAKVPHSFELQGALLQVLGHGARGGNLGFEQVAARDHVILREGRVVIEAAAGSEESWSGHRGRADHRRYGAVS